MLCLLFIFCCPVCGFCSHQGSPKSNSWFQFSASICFNSLPGARGTQQLWIVHIIKCPLQQQTIAGAACTPGYAFDVGVNRKLRSHLSDCPSVGVVFISPVADTLGGLAKDNTSHWQGPREKKQILMTHPFPPSTSSVA